MEESNILIIYGGPRKTGTLHKIISAIAKENKSTIVYLNDLKYKDCSSCFFCKEHDHCIFEDDLVGVYDLINNHRKLLFVSPIFYGHITGLLKSLIDRLFLYSTIEFNKATRKNKYSSKNVDVRRIQFIGSHGNSVQDVLDSVERTIKYACVDLNGTYLGSTFVGPLDFTEVSDVDLVQISNSIINKFLD